MNKKEDIKVKNEILKQLTTAYVIIDGITRTLQIKDGVVVDIEEWDNKESRELYEHGTSWVGTEHYRRCPICGRKYVYDLVGRYPGSSEHYCGV